MEHRRDETSRDESTRPPPAAGAAPGQRARPSAGEEDPAEEQPQEAPLDLRVRTLRHENDESGGH